MKYEPNLPERPSGPSNPSPASEELYPGTLKAAARARMREGCPGEPRGVLRLTLIYLLLTELVGQIVNLLPGNPITALSDRMMEAYASGSTEAVMAVYDGAGALFSPPAARVVLFLTILAALYSIVMSFGYSGAMLELRRGGQPEVRDLFSRFHMAGRIILLTLLIWVFIYLWSLLLLIPGLIAMYRYRMGRYILLDRQEKGALFAWRESKRLMRGHKWQLFLVDLSFLPWYLLMLVLSYGSAWLLSMAGLPALAVWVSFAVGLAFSVYLNPYIELTVVGFYERVRGAAG